jgi:metallophosphoesterase superfamily enzyme
MKDYYVLKNILFVHGHKNFSKIFQDKINMVVMGHIHPSILLKDKQNVKREKYKCFLVGKFKRKKVIIVPSFLATIEGTSVNDYKENYEDYFSIIPKKSLMKFEVFVVNEKGKDVYEFGKVEKLKLK